MKVNSPEFREAYKAIEGSYPDDAYGFSFAVERGRGEIYGSGGINRYYVNNYVVKMSSSHAYDKKDLVKAKELGIELF